VDRSGTQRDAAEPLQTVADPVAAELEAALALRRFGADPKSLAVRMHREPRHVVFGGTNGALGKIESIIQTVQRELWEVVHFDSVAEAELALTTTTAARTWASAAWSRRTGASSALERSGVQRNAAEPLQVVADPVAAELEAALALRRTGADPKALRRALRRFEELLDE
jgi:hypothetical protein